MAAAAVPPPGIYVPVPTFFVGKQAAGYDAAAAPPDAEAQAAHALYLARAGIRGLVVLGSTGEAVHLTDAERGAVLAGVRAALDRAGFPDYPILAGTATQGVEDTLAQLRAARDAGAQWGMCLAPGYFAGASTQEGIIRWFTAIADRSPIPILIYYYPGVSNNVKITPATFEALAAHPNIVGCKLSHGDVSAHAQIASSPAVDHARFRTFTGLGQQLLPVVAVGGAGAIDGCAGFFPKTVVRLYELSARPRPTDAELAERRRLQFKVSRVEELVARFGTVGIKEAVSRLRGFGDRDGTRLPLHGGIPGGDAEWANWEAIADSVQEEEDRL
ncbi:putative dihydrodipicolinate synthase [Rosellinia necatrix]|uniref:Putative dihydrodipicolinate synthase n=1 Tax=Rosellinia necatrix TaxID=77044 RepID=A0A1S7UIG1_ROSNE|nr:putative dihydrodipicolinate synthase [Rosellinia necatrix]